MQVPIKINNSFFNRDVLIVAPDLLGKKLVRKIPDGKIKKYIITEVEAYRGEEDLACHASKGRTARTEVMYWEGGYIYVFLIYGIHYMLNFVCGEKNNPQAILIRGLKDINGPGRVSKALRIDKSFNKTQIHNSEKIWLENNHVKIAYTTSPRVGIEYAGAIWKNKPWRFVMK